MENYDQKPPLGITPTKFWNEQRKRDIEAAMIRYVVAQKEIPKTWIAEWKYIRDWLGPVKGECGGPELVMYPKDATDEKMD